MTPTPYTTQMLALLSDEALEALYADVTMQAEQQALKAEQAYRQGQP